MSTILIINGSRLVSGVQYPGISSIASFVKKAGHTFRFFDTAEYASTVITKEQKNSKELIHVQHKLVLNNELQRKPLENLLVDLENSIEELHPDVIGFSCFTDDWPFTLFLIRHVYDKYSEIPIIVGGVHPTVAPKQVIKHMQVTAVCIGEGERPVVELLNSLDKGKIDTSIQNFWFRTDQGYIANKLRPALEFTEEVPFCDWDHYNDLHFMYPYNGKLYRRGSVSLGRGCPNFCSYCINSFYKNKLYDFGYKVRIKSLDYVIEEIAYLVNKFELNFLRFWDETFLCVPMDYFRAFAKRYSNRIGLPFTIETTAPSISSEKLQLLVDMGCQSMSLGVETSNEDLRRQVLKKNISNSCFSKVFALIDQYNIRKSVNFMFFLPHQTIDDMYQDIGYCRDHNIKIVAPRIFYPYAGTALRNYCLNNNLLERAALEKIEDENVIHSLTDLNSKRMSDQDTVLKFDEETKQAGKIYLENFFLFQEIPEWMHGWVYKLLEQKNTIPNIIFDELTTIVYKKRFGE